jgi:hypothetical protein
MINALKESLTLKEQQVLNDQLVDFWVFRVLKVIRIFKVYFVIGHNRQTVSAVTKTT